MHFIVCINVLLFLFLLPTNEGFLNYVIHWTFYTCDFNEYVTSVFLELHVMFMLLRNNFFNMNGIILKHAYTLGIVVVLVPISFSIISIYQKKLKSFSKTSNFVFFNWKNSQWCPYYHNKQWLSIELQNVSFHFPKLRLNCFTIFSTITCIYLNSVWLCQK